MVALRSVALASTNAFSAAVAGRALAQEPTPAPQHTERQAPPPEEDADDDVFTIQLGSTLNFGNTRALQLAGGTHSLRFIGTRIGSVVSLISWFTAQSTCSRSTFKAPTEWPRRGMP